MSGMGLGLLCFFPPAKGGLSILGKRRRLTTGTTERRQLHVRSWGEGQCDGAKGQTSVTSELLGSLKGGDESVMPLY